MVNEQWRLQEKEGSKPPRRIKKGQVCLQRVKKQRMEPQQKAQHEGALQREELWVLRHTQHRAHVQGIAWEGTKFSHLVMEKYPLPSPGAMPAESNFPKCLPGGSGHQTPFCKLGCPSRAEMIDLPENKINSPSHSK